MITQFTEKDRDAIRILNYEWLQKYFSIEPIDVLVLNNPEKEIIQKGGKIFYAWHQNEIVGTVSLMKINEQEVELTKMAVTANCQGLGLGKQLMETAISNARKDGFKKILIYSNKSLETAIELYKKYGFEEVLIENNHYERCNIMMEKIIGNQ